MIKIAVCDDDRDIIKELRDIISDYAVCCEQEICVSEFYNGESLIGEIREKGDFDLIFLDIELGVVSGIDVGYIIRNEFDDHISRIVFITSKDGYESAVFDVQPFNFIRKPIDAAKVRRCLNLAVKMLNADNTVFEYRKKGETVRVFVKDILYFESERKKILIVTRDFEDTFYSTMSAVKDALPDNFVESHGSFLVNFDKIRIIGKNSVKLYGGIEIPVSQRNMKSIRSMLVNQMRAKR